MSSPIMKASFVAHEVRLGLRRNLTMTIAVIVTVAVSLALLGTAWLTGAQVNTMKDYWYGKIQVSVFLTNDITDAQRTALHDTLAADPLVATVFHESKAEAYQHFSEQFRGSPDLVASITPQSLPESFRVKLKDPSRYAEVGQRHATDPGVQQITDQSGTLDKLFRLIGALQNAAYGAATCLLLATGLLVFNAMRVAANQRRREIAVMQLVGASKRFIATPFVIEAALAGAVGAILGAGGLALVKATVVDSVLAPAFKFTTFVGWGTVATIAPLLLLVGVGTSALAAAVTVHRQLREPAAKTAGRGRHRGRRGPSGKGAAGQSAAELTAAFTPGGARAADRPDEESQLGETAELDTVDGDGDVLSY